MFTETSPGLVETFLSAVRVDALSLHERPMADFIRGSLSGLPLRIVEDGAGREYGGTSGNLICIPDTLDTSRPAIALVAHMDTPRPTSAVRPIAHPDRITSDGTSILGVDNRAGTSVLLLTLREIASKALRSNVIVVFTIAEEIGLFGSKHLDLSPYNVRMGFVFDCSRRPGVYIRSAVGCSLFTATFHGRAAHAGVAPEKGIHAIQLASRAVGAIPLGRVSPHVTANVGMIHGGEATNIVPDRCLVEGEVRSFHPSSIEEYISWLGESFRSVARDGGGDVELQARVDFSPFTLDPSADVCRWTEQAITRSGLTPTGIEYLGGSDANSLNARGLPTVNLGIGAQNPHGDDEFILLEDLHASAAIARALVAMSMDGAA